MSRLPLSSRETQAQQPFPSGLLDSAKVDLFVASFLALFMEVMLIRWIPAYERVLAYFTNFVLIATFLGLGLGAMFAARRRSWIQWQPFLILFLVAISVIFNQFVKTGPSIDDVYYSEFKRQARVSLSVSECLGFFFFLVAMMFVPLGQRIGECLRAVSPPLKGYIINILGSLAGVLTFTAVSFLGLGPWWWFAVTMLGLLWFVRQEKDWRILNALIGVFTVVAVWMTGEMYWWTPYNKMAVRPMVEEGDGWKSADEMVRPNEASGLRGVLGLGVTVNDDFYQQPTDLSPRSVQAHSNIQAMVTMAENYNLPFRIPGFSYNDILIVGAGTGNDVAAALRLGARHVDAVDIDPEILRLGRAAHPEQPYSDPRVRVVVNDARAFFNGTNRKYDLVVFALLDAKRLFSSMSSVRLDSFVFTVESFQEVRKLLKDDGIVVVKHSLGNIYMNIRMYQTLTEAFGDRPYVQDPNGGPTFFAGPGVKKFIKASQTIDFAPVDLATDDWPFFYLRGRQLPPEYRVALEAMALVTLACLLFAAKDKMRTVNGHFFFLGAAFLLIETVSVTRFALLFGSTWMVNSIVFSSILLVILFANLWMNRILSFNIHWLYALLAIAVLINFMFPIHALLHTGLMVRLLISMILMASPIFFAAFIFAHSYKQASNPDLAFASNLLGAVAGGLLEYSSLVIGFRSLLLIALGLYALSYLALLLPMRKAAAATT
jgi:SAM-dependent methyltransferase